MNAGPVGARETMPSNHLREWGGPGSGIEAGRSPVLALGLIWLLLWLALPASLAAWQAEPTFLKSDAEYNFGQMMRFSLEATSPSPVRRVTLYIQTPDLPYRLTADFEAGLQESIALSRNVDLTQLRLAPFTTVTFWWELETDDGEIFRSGSQTLEYVDNQFSWQRLDQDGIQIHWSGEGDTVGREARAAVLDSLSTIESVIPVSRPDPLKIYIYPSADDLRSGLRLSGRDWVGAHAHPELGVILVAADGASTASSELARSIAHELAHLYVYEATGEGHDSVPLWLDEGIASMVEGAAGNPNYATRLAEAVSSGETFDLADLCYTLPAGADDALLAYAQSTAFVNFLQREYGDQALPRIIAAIADGADCQAAPLRVLGKSLAELNEEWLEQEKPKSLLERTWLNGRAWIVIIGAGFLLAGLLAIVPRKEKR